MNRDVQRTFVLLRQLAGGRESGYARAETRDGKVSLNLVVQGFDRDAVPYAFAVTDDGLLLIGQLNMDARGQGGIAALLNPSDLRRIQVLFVGFMDGQAVNIPLAGTVGRNGWVDWTQVRALVAEALQPDRTEETGDSSEPIPQPENGAADQPETVECEPAEQAGSKSGEAQSIEPEADAPEATETEPLQEGTAEPKQAEEQAVPPVEQETEELDIYDLPAQEDPFEVVERELRTPLPQEKRQDLPEALRNVYWPQVLWPLHDLFERFAQVTPFSGQEDTVYIRVPLGEAYRQIDHYLIGAKLQDGWVIGVGYLIPGTYSEQTPAGMAGYEWKDGYWQSWQYVENE